MRIFYTKQWTIQPMVTQAFRIGNVGYYCKYKWGYWVVAHHRFQFWQ